MGVRELSLPRPSEAHRMRLRWSVARRDISLAISLALAGLLIVSFVSGWIASLLGLTEFGLHKYSSLAVFGLGLVHLGLHWRPLAAQVRRLYGGGAPKRPGGQS
jgi:hypothetical protein